MGSPGAGKPHTGKYGELTPWRQRGAAGSACPLPTIFRGRWGAPQSMKISYLFSPSRSHSTGGFEYDNDFHRELEIAGLQGMQEREGRTISPRTIRSQLLVASMSLLICSLAGFAWLNFKLQQRADSNPSPS